jgi:dienelactone hydrolase
MRRQRRKRRASRLRGLVLATIGTLILLGVGGWTAGLLRSGSSAVGTTPAESRPASTRSGSTRPDSTRPASTRAAAPGRPIPPQSAGSGETPTGRAATGTAYAVGVTSLTVEDTSRPTASRSGGVMFVEDPEAEDGGYYVGVPGSGGTDTRQLLLTVRYPAAGVAGGDEIEDGPVARGRFPLVVFAHGFNAWAAIYEALLHDFAQAGFVVVAPEFPLSSGALPGPARRDDIENQAADMSFLITAFQAGDVPSIVKGHVAQGKVGVAGHSDGGRTVAALAGSSCCSDPRIGAAAVLTGDEQGGTGTWFDDPSPAMMFVHGTQDATNPYGASLTLYADARPPKYLVAIVGGGHHEPFTTGEQEPYISAVVADFFHAYLEDDDDALRSIAGDAERDGVLELAAWE